MTLVRETEIFPYGYPEDERPLFDLEGRQVTDPVEHAALETLHAICAGLACLVLGEFRKGHEVVGVAFRREVRRAIDDPSTMYFRVTTEIIRR